jgi:HEAT repeat protein
MAAWRGIVRSNPEQGIGAVCAALTSGDPALESMGLCLAPEVAGAGASEQLAKCVAKVPGPVQALLLGALAARGDVAARGVVAAGLSSQDPDVRLAAINALGILGDAASVKTLVEGATASGATAERQAARNSLVRLRGPRINQELIGLLSREDPGRQAEVIRILAARNAASSPSALERTTGAADATVRKEAWKALGSLAGAADVPALLERLVRAQDEERDDAEKAVAVVLERPGRSDLRAVLQKLETVETPAARASLIRLVSAVGDDTALPALRQAVQSGDAAVRDAAVRGLAGWPTPTPFEDLLSLARAPGESVHRVLALRAAIRLAGKVGGRTPEQMTALLTELMQLAEVTADRKAVLAELGRCPTADALRLARKYQADPELAAEAGMAVNQISSALQNRPPNQVGVKSGNPGATVGSLLRPDYSWKQTDAALALLNHGRVVWQLNYATNQAKPYFHPVALVDGTVLTAPSPADHPWHRALWFSWKMLNGVNYWEEDRATGKSQGLSEVRGVSVKPNPDGSARIALALSYHPPQSTPVLTENRLLDVSAPDERGAYRIDWRGAFTAGDKDVLLQGGAAGGGYAGLSVRVSQASGDWVLIDSEGRRDIPTDGNPANKGGLAVNTHGHRARWADFSLVDTATQQPCGIAILAHPSNPRHPSPWHNILAASGRFGYFSPAMLWSEPFKLAAGQRFTLRYRVLVHPGRPDPDALEKEWQAFASRD